MQKMNLAPIFLCKLVSCFLQESCFLQATADHTPKKIWCQIHFLHRNMVPVPKSADFYHQQLIQRGQLWQSRNLTLHFVFIKCVLPKKWQLLWSDEDWSADATAAANCVFVIFQNFGALQCLNRWSDFDQIFSAEWIIALYLWFNFHPILFSRFGDTRGGLTQLFHTVVVIYTVKRKQSMETCIIGGQWGWMGKYIPPPTLYEISLQ